VPKAIVDKEEKEEGERKDHPYPSRRKTDDFPHHRICSPGKRGRGERSVTSASLEKGKKRGKGGGRSLGELTKGKGGSTLNCMVGKGRQ